MKVFHGYKNIHGLNDPIVAIGIFDGIHIGHKRILNRVLNSGEKGRDKVVMTFDPHPKGILTPDRLPPRIMSIEHRLLILERMGIDAVIIVRFSESLAAMSPEDFIRRVIAAVGIRTVYVGDNFYFGHGKRGDVNTFREVGKPCGVEVRKVRSVRKKGKVVSSTWLRRLIAGGRIKEAEALLRRPVSVLGTVVKGDERGKTLGIPTANIDPYQEVIPPSGVYAVKVDIEGNIHDGVLNIGFKPTFYGRRLKRRKEPHIEVNVFGFTGHLYGLSIEIFFIERLRREKRFRNARALIKQINIDKERAKVLLSSPRILRKIKRYKYL